jgi:hypothetical protein
MRTKTRKERLPVNGNNRDILTIKGHGIPLCDCASKGHKRCQDETHLHPCWVNDYNVERFKEAGYEPWQGTVKVGDKKLDAASSMTDSTVSKAVGNGVTAILMVLPQQWYDEDMLDMEQQTKEKEAIMKRQFHGDARYGKVEIERHGQTETIKVG